MKKTRTHKQKGEIKLRLDWLLHKYTVLMNVLPVCDYPHFIP